MTGLVEIFAGWPLAASMTAAAVAAQGLRAGRRRSALNEALHELRRPLQALALAGDRAAVPPRVLASSVELAGVALERLDREVNGGGAPTGPREAVRMRPLVEAATGRWQARARLSGGSLRLGWWAGEALVAGERAALAQAVDNLLVNAIEHGGPAVAIEARRQGSALRLVIADSGRASRPPSRRGTPGDTIARLSGRRRRGHGLAVVRRVAGEHGGRFVLRSSDCGSLAVLELPLANDRDDLVA
ncbi:MAG TPA: HAMP domain-containing sensor histidine kinase [Solirubrobacterales bacterium]|jgi:signal transduction histidine kinase|nr:HAMP domain-containing sensor histidine kinase [Solirubrobacterales bacterium]